MKIIDKVALIHIKEHKILSTISKNNKLYFLPGGKRENNESDYECLKREIQEELDVKIILDSIEFFGLFETPLYKDSKDVFIKMTCYFANFTGNLKAKNEIESFHWLEYDDRKKSSFVDQLIFKRLKEKKLIK